MTARADDTWTSRPPWRWGRSTTVSRVASSLVVGLALVSATVLAAPNASAATDTVTTCAGSGAGSLPAVVAAASAGDTISFSVSCPTSSPIVLSATIDITVNLEITSASAGPVAISGNGAVEDFDVEPGASAALVGLTIENGSSTGSSGINTGGIDNAGSLQLIDSTVTGNKATGSGAGIDTGGIYNSGTLTISNDTLYDNSGIGGVDTGAVYNVGTLEVNNSTLAGNSGIGGGGTNTGGIDNAAGSAAVGQTIVADSAGADCLISGGTLSSAGADLADDGTCGFMATNGLVNTAAGLDPNGPVNNGGPTATIALEPGSAAIGAVLNGTDCGTPDQRGVTRPSPCDIGAYQTFAPQVTNCSDSGPGSLRQSVLYANPGGTIAFAGVLSSCPAATIAVDSPITITRNLTIDGPGPNALAVNGGDAVGDFVVDAAVSAASISGLTIADGSAPKGGGIDNAGTLTVTDCALSGDNTGPASYAGGGGGIYNTGTLTVNGSDLTDDAAANTVGGGIDNENTLTVNDSTLSDDSASDGYGGGIFYGATVSSPSQTPVGMLTVNDSTLSDDSAGNGGGISGTDSSGGTIAGGPITVTGSTLSGNSAETYGGGIFSDGTLTVTDSALADNDTEATGGGIWSRTGTATVTDTTFTGNTAESGAGISVYDTTTDITDSTFTSNDAGGIGVADSTVTVGDSTISGNSGGGIVDYAGAPVTVTNATVSGNSGSGVVGPAVLSATIVSDSGTGGDCSEAVTDDGYNLADDTTCGFSSANHSLSDVNPDLDALKDNGGPTDTMALEPGSPAIGAVSSPTLCSTPDQRGTVRPTPCDIGAYQTNPTVGQTITFQSAPPTDATVGGPSYTVSATGGGSGNPVIFSIGASATSVCTVTGATVSFTAVGQCVVDANQAAATGYSAAPEAQQSFSVGPAAPAITSAGATVGTVGTHFSFTVTTVGTPVPVIDKSGALPKHVTLVDNHDGTATLSGSPTKAAVYAFTIEARFGKGKAKVLVKQTFTLTVDPPA